ncbi:MAG: nuclear transport factor 2 family protein [Woeseiaceae bacterium]|nr:nuclear transport factor 2 family protein [Woeseiaceae bacterium]
MSTRITPAALRTWASLVMLLLAVPAIAADDDIGTLSTLLDEFLAGASSNDIEAHERFWSDELVYTSSNGTRFGKSDILAGIRDSTPGQSDAPATIYTAEDVDIRIYGDTAIVAFRLVGKSEADTAEYFNTGTFVRKNGEWRAVAWQATRIPAPGNTGQ